VKRLVRPAGPGACAQGVSLENGDPIVTIRDFLRFAKLVA
jgi:hypothetical protein